jgi:hypothetical protein
MKASRGKVFNFKPEAEWGHEVAQQVQLSSQYRSHMVIVLGKALTRPPGWVRIVTVCIQYTLWPRIHRQLLIIRVLNSNQQRLNKIHK